MIGRSDAGSLHRTRTVALLFAGLLAAGCGSTTNQPVTRTSPTPSPPEPGGVVTGHYLLQIVPAPGCALSRAALTFPMEAAPAGTSPHPGVQVVLSGNPSSLEAEFLYENSILRGGIGTTGDGVLSNEGQRLWIHAIGTGRVTHVGAAQGEVTAGMLMGYLALGGPRDEEGALGTCSALDHAFTLRTR